MCNKLIFHKTQGINYNNSITCKKLNSYVYSSGENKVTIDLTSEDIDKLIEEEKILPDDFRDLLNPRNKRGHKEAQLKVMGEKGSIFFVIIRQSIKDLLDFSVILGYQIPNTNRKFRLRRYNGKTHEHTNGIEGEKFFNYHIHKATERYQEQGKAPDVYAEETDRYVDLQGAVQCLLDDCGFVLPKQTQLSF